MKIPSAKEKNINSRIYCPAALVLNTQYGSERRIFLLNLIVRSRYESNAPNFFFLLNVAPGRVFASPTG